MQFFFYFVLQKKSRMIINTKTVWRKPSDKGPGERILIDVKISCCCIHTRLMLLKSVSGVQNKTVRFFLDDCRKLSATKNTHLIMLKMRQVPRAVGIRVMRSTQ